MNFFKKLSEAFRDARATRWYRFGIKPSTHEIILTPKDAADTVKVMAEAMLVCLNNCKDEQGNPKAAENYVEWQMALPPRGTQLFGRKFALTLQRCEKFTPNDLKLIAEEELAKERARNDRLATERANYRTQLASSDKVLQKLMKENEALRQTLAADRSTAERIADLTERLDAVTHENANRKASMETMKSEAKVFKAEIDTLKAKCEDDDERIAQLEERP